MDNLDLVKEIVSEVFNYPINLINVNTTPVDIENWDSMNHLILISSIENHFKIEIDADDFDKLMKINDILILLNTKYNK
jgi:acyl carrier protein